MAPSARSYALKLVKQRLRSRSELDTALAKRGVESDERASIIRELEEVGLINDARFATAWVHDRDRFSPRGTFVLKRELRAKGVSDADITRALAARGGEEPIDEYSQALELITPRRARLQHLPQETRNRRLAHFLLRRGFSPDTVRRILEA